MELTGLSQDIIHKVSKVYELKRTKNKQYIYYMYLVHVFNKYGKPLSSKTFAKYKEASIHRLEQILIMKGQRNESLNIPDFNQLIKTDLWKNHFRKPVKFYYL